MGCAGVSMLGAVQDSVTSSDKRSFKEHIHDSQLKIALNKLIHSDRAVRKYTHINVYSHNTHVFLIGQAPNDMLHDKVIQAVQESEYAANITLHDFIRIKKPSSFIQRSRDSLISTRLKSAYLHHDDIDGKRIQITTENAEVFLFGQTTKKEASKAIHLARSEKGVKRVVHIFEYIDEAQTKAQTKAQNKSPAKQPPQAQQKTAKEPTVQLGKALSPMN